MGRRTKTRKAFALSKKTRFKETQPELLVRELLKSVGYTQQRYYVPLVYTDRDDKEWTFEPDIEVPPNVVIEVDGHPSHFTRRGQQKMNWRDDAILSLGKRVIHLDASLLKTKDLQMYALRELQKAIQSKAQLVRIRG